jgi:hypothetical protein
MSGPDGASSRDRLADLAANANDRRVDADVQRVGSGFEVRLDGNVVARERRFDRAIEQMVAAARRVLPHPPHREWGALVNCLCGPQRFAFAYGNLRQPGGRGARFGPCVQDAIAAIRPTRPESTRPSSTPSVRSCAAAGVGREGDEYAGSVASGQANGS